MFATRTNSNFWVSMFWVFINHTAERYWSCLYQYSKETETFWKSINQPKKLKCWVDECTQLGQVHKHSWREEVLYYIIRDNWVQVRCKKELAAHQAKLFSLKYWVYLKEKEFPQFQSSAANFKRNQCFHRIHYYTLLLKSKEAYKSLELWIIMPKWLKLNNGVQLVSLLALKNSRLIS